MGIRDWFGRGEPTADAALDELTTRFRGYEDVQRDGFVTLGNIESDRIARGTEAEQRSLLDDVQGAGRDASFTLNSPQAVAFFTGRDVIDGAKIVSTEVAWRDSVWVRKCIMHTANPISKLTWELYNGTSLIKSHPVYDLLANPNPYFTTTFLWATTVAILQLYGECFWWLIREDILAPAHRIEFFNPRYVTPIIDKSRLELLGYRVMMPSGGSAVIDKNDMVHFKHPNPFNRWRGSAPLESVALSVSSDLASQRYNLGFFQRGAVPAGVLVTDKALSPTQSRDVLTQFEGRHRDSHKVGILHSGLSWQETQQNAKDMEFAQSRKFNREEILAAFGVPPVEVGVLEFATYNNLREQTKVFWLKTLIPIGGIICDGIDKDLVRDDSLHSEFDTDHVEELRDALKDKMDIADRLWSKGMPWKDIDKFLDLGTGRFDGDDHGFIPFNLTPILPAIDAAENPPEPPPQLVPPEGGDNTPPPPGDEKPTEKPKEGEGAPTDETKAKALRLHSYLRSIGHSYEDARLQVNNTWAAMGESGLDTMLRCIGAALRNEAVSRARRESTDGVIDWTRVQHLLSTFEADAQEAVEPLAREAAPAPPAAPRVASKRDSVTADQLAEIDRIIEEHKAKLADLGEAFFKQAASVGVEQMAELLGIDFDLANPKIANFLATKIINITAIEDTTKDKIRDLIDNALEEGSSVDDLAKALKADYNFGPDRAEAIARTEMASTVNGARFLVAQEEGVEQHEWLSARDGRVRESHVEADGQVVEFGQQFPATGLRFPGEPDGPAEEVINCRCITLPADNLAQESFNASLRCTCEDPANCHTSTSCRRNIYWQNQVRGYAQVEKRFAGKLSKHFYSERTAILKVLSGKN